MCRNHQALRPYIDELKEISRNIESVSGRLVADDNFCIVVPLAVMDQLVTAIGPVNKMIVFFESQIAMHEGDHRSPDTILKEKELERKEEMMEEGIAMKILDNAIFGLGESEA